MATPRRLREVLSMSADGKTLTVQITTTAAEKAASSLVYTRITDVGPCEKWPTPCKRAPGIVAGERRRP